MSEVEAPETRSSRRLRRVAVAAGIVLVVVILLAVAGYTIVFLILAPMMA